ncbi:MAG: c-type cytochrome [Kiloniellaceae bacterium]
MVQRGTRAWRSFRPSLFLGVLCAWSVLAVASDAQAQSETTPAQRLYAQASSKGKQLFANTCGFCHHKGGRKAGKGPKLAGSARSDEFLFNRIRNGKRGRMPAYGKTFSEEEIRAIVAYIRSLNDE